MWSHCNLNCNINCYTHEVFSGLGWFCPCLTLCSSPERPLEGDMHNTVWRSRYKADTVTAAACCKKTKNKTPVNQDWTCAQFRYFTSESEFLPEVMFSIQVPLQTDQLPHRGHLKYPSCLENKNTLLVDFFSASHLCYDFCDFTKIPYILYCTSLCWLPTMSSSTDMSSAHESISVRSYRYEVKGPRLHWTKRLLLTKCWNAWERQRESQQWG